MIMFLKFKEGLKFEGDNCSLFLRNGKKAIPSVSLVAPGPARPPARPPALRRRDCLRGPQKKLTTQKENRYAIYSPEVPLLKDIDS
jgi:hypothetical protein